MLRYYPRTEKDSVLREVQGGTCLGAPWRDPGRQARGVERDPTTQSRTRIRRPYGELLRRASPRNHESARLAESGGGSRKRRCPRNGHWPSECSPDPVELTSRPDPAGPGRNDHHLWPGRRCPRPRVGALLRFHRQPRGLQHLRRAVDVHPRRRARAASRGLLRTDR